MLSFLVNKPLAYIYIWTGHTYTSQTNIISATEHDRKVVFIYVLLLLLYGLPG